MLRNKLILIFTSIEWNYPMPADTQAVVGTVDRYIRVPQFPFECLYYNAVGRNSVSNFIITYK